MARNVDRERLSVLERLDLAIARRVDDHRLDVELTEIVDLEDDLLGLSRISNATVIAELLGLRGILVHRDEVAAILAGSHETFTPDHQEYALTHGLRDALRKLRARCATGTPPDGWFLVELFRTMTADVPRFRNNHLRKDEPWDAIPFQRYPAPSEVSRLLDTFNPSCSYRDVPELFGQLHPVRQAARILWRLGRIAPFPDFNVLIAFLAMNGFLMAHGYPSITPDRDDRRWLPRFLVGPVPRRMTRYETRLLRRLQLG